LLTKQEIWEFPNMNSLNTILYSHHPNMLLAYKTIITVLIIYETI